MRFQGVLISALLLMLLACRSPLTEVHSGREGPVFSLTLGIEDHSRKLAHLGDPGSVIDTPESRRAALERHRKAFEDDFRKELAERGVRFDPFAELHLDLIITSLGEVHRLGHSERSGLGRGHGSGGPQHAPRRGPWRV